ncbi:hypothetical protein ABH15_03070 [Methanoculleus taiwanensis]|uniref:Dockerin domain-containing protein n=1 Tax=Methanoculleus taiwanensis TaxID=1550565 RepID=A0A498H273_9EURY|nr:dockerin type I domain-containing protein [Methanoculleus taiwanensis]RXE57121.1 hypothetical protein ABH15_03070 [Methanoculleus taiwanensis]
MKNRVFVACMLAFAACIVGGAAAAAPGIEWSYKFGGSGTDYWPDIAATADGGSIFAGQSNSQDGNITDPLGLYDIVLLKQDADGAVEWQKNIGGTGNEASGRVRQTSDGGFILTGTTKSNDNDVSGLHGTYYDIWVAKFTESGSIEWQTCLGGSHTEDGMDVRQTSDGGYIVVGNTYSTDGDVTDRIGGTADAWVVKLNSTGGIGWTKCVGRDGEGEMANGVVQMSGGDYIIAGSSNVDSQWDGLVARLNSTGGIVWETYFGGTADDGFMGGPDDAELSGVTLDDDGNAIVVGTITLEEEGISDHNDVYLVKVDGATGAVVWEKTFGGSRTEYGVSIDRTSDGGYILGATTGSVDGDVSGVHGDYPPAGDYWIVKLDSSFTIEWQKCVGGTGPDCYPVVAQTTDGGFVCGGYTSSTDGDVPALSYNSNFDFWIVKLAPETPAGPPVPAAPPVCPSPAASPDTIPTDTDGSAGWGESAALSVNVTGESTITSVTVNLSSIGGSASAAMAASGSVWSLSTNATTASPFSGGAYQPVNLTVTATDAGGRTNTTVIVLTVITNGDVNEDASVNLHDAYYLARSVLGVPGYTMHTNVADVSGDGAASLFDAVYLARHILGVTGYGTLH